MNLADTTAKEIIIRAPLSTEYEYLTPRRLKRYALEFDRAIQNWALKQSDNFSSEEWEHIRLRKIRDLLTHAKKYVPYWNKLLTDLRFEPEKMLVLNEVRRIPTISRAQMKKDDIRVFSSTALARSRFLKAATSGSTSEPFSFFQDSREVFRRIVNTAEEFRYLSEPLTKRCIIIGLEHHQQLTYFGQGFELALIENKFLRLNRLYPQIEALKPEVLYTTPALLKRLAYFVRKDGRELYFKRIFYRGESMSKEETEILSEQFKAKLGCHYASRECSLIGIQCKESNFHLAPWVNLVEILNDKDEPVATGEEGNIVITFFENFAVPFIRYKIGDRGRLSQAPCECGRTTSVVIFDGRSANSKTDFILFPNHGAISVQGLLHYFAQNYANFLLTVQFEKVSDTHLKMRYVPLSPLSDVDEGPIRTYLESFFNEGTRVTLDRVENIVMSPRGKSIPYIDSTVA